MRRLAILLAVAVTPHAAAQAFDHRLAFSQRLGVEVMAPSADWCRPNPTLRVVAERRDGLSSADLPALLQRLGSTLIARDCPQVREVSIDGLVRGSEDIVWRGTLVAADAWALRQAGSRPAADLDVPATALGARGVPPGAGSVQVPPARVADPIIGDWSGPIAFPQDVAGRTITVSFHALAEGRLRAVVEITAGNARNGWNHPRGALRLEAEGPYDPSTGLFNLIPNAIARANGQSFAVDGWRYIGQRAPDHGAIQLQIVSSNERLQVGLTRRSDQPRLAERLAADRRLSAALFQEATAPQPGRPLGSSPPGGFRQPTCEALQQWAGAFPLDLRVELNPLRPQGILRHFEDEPTRRVFGSPIYYWVATGHGPQARFPRGDFDLSRVVDEACNRVPDSPRMQALRRVVQDESAFQVAQRRVLDWWLARAQPEAILTGGTPEEALADLAAIQDERWMRSSLGAVGAGLDVGMLRSADREFLAARRVRLLSALAERSAEEFAAEASAQPPSAHGVTTARGLLARHQRLFPGLATPPPLREAVARAELAAAPAITDAAIAELRGLPADHEGERAARDLFDRTSALLPDGWAGRDELVAALAQWRREAAATAVARLRALPREARREPEATALSAAIRSLVLASDASATVASGPDAMLAEWRREAGDATLAGLRELARDLSLERQAEAIASAARALLGRGQEALVDGRLEEWRAAAASGALNQAVEAISALPPDAAGLARGRALATETRSRLSNRLPEVPERLEATLGAFQARVQEVLLRDAISRVAEAPATGEGARLVRAQRAALVAQLGQPLPAGLAAFEQIADQRLQQAAAAVAEDLRASLATLSEDWPSIGDARRRAAAAAAAFGDHRSGHSLLEAGEERARIILSGLADRAAQRIGSGGPASNLAQVLAPLDQANEAAQPFSAVPGGERHVERLLAEGRRRAEELAAAYAPAHMRDLAAARASVRAAEQLALLVVFIDLVDQDHPGLLAAFRAPTLAAARAAWDGLCEASAAALPAGWRDRPLLVGRDTPPLGEFLCSLARADIRTARVEVTAGADPVLVLWVPERLADLPAAQAAQALAQLFGRPLDRRGDTVDYDILDLSPLASDLPPEGAVVRVALREVEALPGRRALVGVGLGDAAQLQPLTVRNWQEWSMQLVAAVRPEVRCDADPTTLGARQAARQILTCSGAPQ